MILYSEVLEKDWKEKHADWTKRSRSKSRTKPIEISIFGNVWVPIWFIGEYQLSKNISKTEIFYRL